MRKVFLQVLVVLVGVGLVAFCQAAAVPLQDFGDPNAKRFWKRLKSQDDKSAREPVRVLQLGDSHTAGDYFSGELRTRMQARFGNAGIGWLTPGYVTNQRSAQVWLRGKGDWQIKNSRNLVSGLFPLGGLINQASSGSTLEIATKQMPAEGLWRVSFWLQAAKTTWQLALPSGEKHTLIPDLTKGPWGVSSVIVDARELDGMKLQANSDGAALGGVTLDRLSPGVLVDALGIVGAKGSVIGKWDSAALREQLRWRKPDLLILAYGTNEAFDLRFNADEFSKSLRETVRLLRTTAPSASILIVGAPSSAKKKPPYVNAGCRLQLAPGLTSVQRVQRQIAKEERTLYWDWSAFMGGVCGAANWIKQHPPLMREDLVHLTPEGYSTSGAALYDALLGAYRSGL